MKFENHIIILKSRGFSLLELVLAVAIFSFSSFALATMIIDSNISTRLSADRTEALLYAKEGIEAVRSIRDNDWTTWVGTADGDYGLLIDAASSTWIFDNSPDRINDKYTRTITLDTNSEVDSSRDVSVNISWDLTPGRIASTTLSTVFSNWPDVINSPFVIPRGLVSYWSFDGNADDPVSGYNGTVYGATLATGTKGIIDTAYSFNGSSDYITTLLTGIGGNFSVSAWINNTQDGVFRGIMSTENGTFTDGFMVRINNDNTLSVLTSNNGIDLNWYGVASVSTGWHFVAVTFNAGDIVVYLDNQIYPISGTAQISTSYLNIGCAYIGGGEPFGGSIDNVRIYRRVLTPDDITTIYNAEKP